MQKYLSRQISSCVSCNKHIFRKIDCKGILFSIEKKRRKKTKIIMQRYCTQLLSHVVFHTVQNRMEIVDHKFVFTGQKKQCWLIVNKCRSSSNLKGIDDFDSSIVNDVYFSNSIFIQMVMCRFSETWREKIRYWEKKSCWLNTYEAFPDASPCAGNGDEPFVKLSTPWSCARKQIESMLNIQIRFVNFSIIE